MSAATTVQTLQFAANVDATAADPAAAIARAQLAEALGFDVVLMQDHPYNAAHLDTWTTLTAIAARTERIGVGSNVSPLPLRPPAMLAKQVASLAALSPGRVILGLGAGGFTQGIQAFGGPAFAPSAAVEALDEGIRLIHQLWTSDRAVTFTGDHYRVHGVRFGPQPTTPIPIWIGAVKPRMMRLTGRLADGLIVSAGYVPPTALPEINAMLDAAASAAGRSPTAIRRAYNVMGRIDDTVTTTAPDIVGAGGAHAVATWVSALIDYARAGRIDTFAFWPDGDRDAQLRRFAADVIPAVRAALDRAP
jgi:alkanesulfonate monooxygenase SsuD/methylene tetrahydromethanopterin reductase-like flavin-dependent oxidoreductase (luciferase family)